MHHASSIEYKAVTQRAHQAFETCPLLVLKAWQSKNYRGVHDAL